MSEATFTISSAIQSVKIGLPNISGSKDSLNAYLHIPIDFILRVTNDEIGFDILPINARLLFQNPTQLLSECIGQTGVAIHGRESNRGYILTFRLNEKVLHFIEKTRTGDLNIQLELRIHTLIKSSIQKLTGRRSFVNDYIQSDSVLINFQIPKSVWIEKILPNLGYRNLKLVEIPLSHNNLKEAYDDIISEFEKAEHYFNLHDYNKCIAHCRSTLDALTRNLKSVKNESKSGTGFKWLETVTKETFNWLDKLNQATQSITSKSHHSGQNVDFTRQEAESIYLIVLGLLNYIGNLAT
ncbi:MAG TPA: hypothetical protein VK671_12470 [Mucilaginibacter sp.]|jgi:hypothetical protein|nr:hypothetical protein [Mucilaginibacter sp.]